MVCAAHCFASLGLLCNAFALGKRQTRTDHVQLASLTSEPAAETTRLRLAAGSRSQIDPLRLPSAGTRSAFTTPSLFSCFSS